MLTHFQCKPLYKDQTLPGWAISFYYEKKRFKAIYHKNGEIEWLNGMPPESESQKVNSFIHELMVFHVYER
ncbi:YheE family protein [Bacillus massiliglaciei]|uniref:YheE family protein n=1 Tax=Bacillus massiliglaciei TaxID=1816693 RepID=UPI000DA5FAB9|nr:YheE family protein [Bacillus massiliglaciei]